MTLEVYLSIALLQMGTDAIITYNDKKRFNYVGSFLLALIWPVTNVLIIIGVSKVTKNYKKYKM